MSNQIYHMTTGLREHLQFVTSQDELDGIETAIQHYIKQFTPNVEAPAQPVCAAIHQTADEILETDFTSQNAAEVVPCRKGCAHCCKQIVMVAKPEGEILYQYAKAHGIALDVERLTRQSVQDDEGWVSMEPADRRCPFLGSDDTCQAYAVRPLSCRKYFAISEPALCNIENFPKGRVEVWYSPDTEVLTTAAFTAFESCSMAKALLNEMGDHQ